MQADLIVLLNSQELYREVMSNWDGRFAGDPVWKFKVLMGVPRADQIKVLREALPNGGEFLFLTDSYAELRDFVIDSVRTVWLNRNGDFVHDIYPIHNVEIRTLDELSRVMPMLNKPTLSQCLRWWDAWEVPENVRSHSRAVSRSAYVLAVMMKNRGLTVDPILAHRAGLLHDIDKITTLNSGVHGAVGAEFILEKGYPGIAEIVRNHIMSTILEPGANEMCWEDKLVYFCDKLVEGYQIVPFDQRLQALKVRYPLYIEIMEQAESAIWALSDEICFILEIAGHQHLVTLLRKFNQTSAEVH